MNDAWAFSDLTRIDIIEWEHSSPFFVIGKIYDDSMLAIFIIVKHAPSNYSWWCKGKINISNMKPKLQQTKTKYPEKLYLRITEKY